MPLLVGRAGGLRPDPGASNRHADPLPSFCLAMPNMKPAELRSCGLLAAVVALVASCGGGGGGGSSTANLSGRVRTPEVAPATLAEAFLVDQPMQPGEVVVWLEPGTDPASLAVDGFELVRGGSGPVAVFRAQAADGRASLRDGAATIASAEQATCDAAVVMKDRTGVKAASPNYMLQPLIEPNDTHFGKQWHYPKINLPQAWNLTTGSSNVIVAILDTGIVAAHPDFDQGRFVDGYDMISSPAVARDGGGRDNNPEDVGDQATPQGSSFHGTHVAGTIGANSNNGIGVAGVDWNCKLMHLRVLGKGGGSIDDIAAGILYAARLPNASGVLPAQRADIINMSLGGPGLNSVLEQACNQAAAAGVLLVAAAGNDNSSQPGSPAAFNSVLSVGAVDLQGARAPYSNFSNTVDIWAPGGDMTTDRNGDGFADGVLSCMADDQGAFFYSFENGTSMACPHVAGVAALLKAANPALTAAELRTILTGTTKAGVNLPNSGRIMDALAAVQLAQSQGGGSATVPLLVATPASVDFGNATSTLVVTIENRGTGNLVLNTLTLSPVAAWLAESRSDATPNNGLDVDRFELTVSRSGLANGVYQTVITLGYLDGTTPVELDIPVRMQVGASTVVTDTIFVLLVDPLTLESRFQTDTAVGSSFNFSFAQVPAGEYILVAGTDRDNDDFLGDDGEIFGAWPDLDDPLSITVTGGANRQNLDFSMQDLQTVQSVGDGTGRRTFRRLR
jgi:serine protease